MCYSPYARDAAAQTDMALNWIYSQLPSPLNVQVMIDLNLLS